METAPSEAFEGAAEEIVEVDNDEMELVGYLDAPNKDTNTHGTRRRVLMGMARTRRPLRTGGMPCLSRYSALRSWGGPWCSSLASPCSSLSHNNLYRPWELS